MSAKMSAKRLFVTDVICIQMIRHKSLRSARSLKLKL